MQGFKDNSRKIWITIRYNIIHVLLDIKTHENIVNEWKTVIHYIT